MDLQQLLLPSHSVEISVSTLDENNKPSILRLKTMIETGYNNGFIKIIAPMQHGRIYVIQSGETIGLTFYATEDNEKAAFEVECKIIERTIQRGQNLYTLKLMSEPQKVQRRQSFRVNILNTYTIERNGRSMEIVTKDMSSTGMRVLSPYRMSTDDLFTIAFDGNLKNTQGELEVDSDRQFSINCRVVDCEPETEIRKYVLRVQFLNLNTRQTQILLQYLYAKEAELIQTNTALSNKRDALEAFFMNSDEDRRKGPDSIIKRYETIGLINILVLFFSVILLLYAQPDPRYVLDYFYNIRRSSLWHTHYYIAAVVSIFIQMLLGLYGLNLNRMRLKRKTDKISISLGFTTISSVILLLIALFLLITQNVFNLA